MASSRWKRFAFFDRKNLSLPPVVVKDIIPSKSSGNRGSTTSDNLDQKFLYQNELSTTNNNEGESLEDVSKIGSGEYFSLVAANNVSLPVSLSSGGEGINDMSEDGASPQQQIMGVATKRGVGGDGAAAMNTSLIALRQQQQNTSTDHMSSRAGGNSSTSNNIMTIKHTNNANNNSSEGDGELMLLFASSRNTSLVHCIDITLRCTPNNPHLLVSSQQQQQDTSENANQIMLNDQGVLSSNNNAFASSTTTTNSPQRNTSTDTNIDVEDLDGWRGHYNPFTSCNGFITTKTKDVNLLGSSTVSGLSPKLPSKSSSSAVSVGSSKRKSAAEQRILDEHTSGDTTVENTGGSLFSASPFANPYPVDRSQQSKQQSMSSIQKARIVGLATCSLSPSSLTNTTQTSQSSNKSSSSILYVAAITDTPNTIGVVVHANPHLMLSSRPPSSSSSSTVEGDGNTKTPYSSFYKPSSLGPFNLTAHGKPRCVTILPGVVCIGTDSGVVLIYVFKCNTVDNSGGKLSLVAEIPAPRSSNSSDGDGEGKKMYSVSSVELIGPSSNETNISNGSESNIHRLFVSYRRRVGISKDSSPAKPSSGSNTNSTSGPSGGVCCYDLGGLRIPGQPIPSSSTGMSTNAPVVSARYDMDGRDVGTSCLCDGVSLPPKPPSFQSPSNENPEESTPNGSGEMEKMLPRYVVARSDGLHLYSPEEKVGVTPIDGSKLAICSLPPPPVVYLRRPIRRQGTSISEGTSAEQSNSDGSINGVGASYALVATNDTKSNRDVVDIYDTSNKLVGYHVLLSPGHRALRTVGIFSSPTVGHRSLIRGGRSSAVILTSGGSIVTLTEKITPDKVELLTQKNLYGAAISLAFSDPQFYCPEDIVALYRRYAEHLYRKGDFSAAMDQYILTIGSLESSHVIFRFLDAPKIHLAVKYLIALRAAGLASSVHDELLRTCYLKLGKVDAASMIILSSRDDASAVLGPDGLEVPTVPISRNLLASSDNPSEMLAAICSLSAEEAVKALVAHGVFIARSLPRETAGVVIALCDGSYSPTDMADAAAGRDGNETKCNKYPISLFQNAFMENPKLFRLILSHCRRNDCVLTPMLRRTLLELTLDEWGAAKRTGDMRTQKLRHDETITLLSENSHVDDMGDYEALVIVQEAGFTEGKIILYERLNMVDLLMEEYAKSGTDRSRRQMLAMGETDPEVLADVLSHFVKMAGDRLNGKLNDDATIDSESEIGGLLYDIHEALVMARDHGELPPVRILRILAGEKNGMFRCDNTSNAKSSVPLSAAIDYVGTIMDESSQKINRLMNNVEEYNRLCNDMEDEINSLLGKKKKKGGTLPNIDDINSMYYNLLQLEEGKKAGLSNEKKITDAMKENFWRDLEQSDSDPFDTIGFYIAKGYLDHI